MSKHVFPDTYPLQIFTPVLSVKKDKLEAELGAAGCGGEEGVHGEGQVEQHGARDGRICGADETLSEKNIFFDEI